MEHSHKPKIVHTSGHHIHTHYPRKSDESRLKIAIGLTFSVMFLEIAGGIFTHSLALLSDAAHMFTHSFALATSFLATYFAYRSKDLRKTFGYYRLEVLASLFNGLTLSIIALVVIHEAIERYNNPQDILAFELFVIAIIGLITNMVTAWILMKSEHDNINVKSAFYHMLGDMLGSFAVVIGAIIIYFT